MHQVLVRFPDSPIYTPSNGPIGYEKEGLETRLTGSLPSAVYIFIHIISSFEQIHTFTADDTLGSVRNWSVWDYIHKLVELTSHLDRRRRQDTALHRKMQDRL